MAKQEAVKNRWIWARCPEGDLTGTLEKEGSDYIVITDERYFKLNKCLYDGHVGDLLGLDFYEFDEVIESHFVIDKGLESAQKVLDEHGISHSPELEEWLKTNDSPMSEGEMVAEQDD